MYDLLPRHTSQQKTLSTRAPSPGSEGPPNIPDDRGLSTVHRRLAPLSGSELKPADESWDTKPCLMS